MDIKDIAQRIPFFDGAMRRRLFAGVTVVVAGVQFFPDLMPLKDVVSPDKLLSSWIGAIFLLLVVFAVGAVLEILGEVIVSGLIGAMIWSIVAPRHIPMPKTRYARNVTLGFLYTFVLPWLMFGALVAALFGVRGFPVPVALKTPGAKRVFGALPPIVKQGMRYPFGEFFDLSWRHMAKSADDEERRQIINKFNYCKDLNVLATVVLFILGMYLVSAGALFDITLTSETATGAQRTIDVDFLGYFTIVAIVLSFVSFIYLLALAVALRSSLELCALHEDEREAEAAPRVSAEGDYVIATAAPDRTISAREPRR